ncbi:alpha-galactosidase [Pedobacter sp. HMWF019]|uniref:glycoside hydrolase family 27 protein n=1 Tax=Pedobacter sp. HMWF019 TaxID=2056856 RepID=UPI000D3972D5|nr:glycoside hydrolase family 27 protein [Pedobacter sp. HMWF019]PTT00938.1 alpha-galactosidase [Pedobacter sp. HMWF019]
MNKIKHKTYLPVFYLLLFCSTGIALRSSAQEPLAKMKDTIYVKGTKIPAAIGAAGQEAEILTPKPGPVPKINGPKIYGCRPGHPFLYRIPATGIRPISFSARGLPQGLRIHKETGIITGQIQKKGTYRVKLSGKSRYGKDTRILEIKCGDQINLSPPMGWNNWYAHYERITDQMMREAADHLVSSGMADAGYQYINIDDCWMNAQHHKDLGRVGRARDAIGNILPNSYFPDMRSLTNYIHGKGLKAGIYTSPGPTTCAGFTGSYGHEAADALQFAKWGFDFLKYDYCSYEYLEKKIRDSLPGITSDQLMKAPYLKMGYMLKSQSRDISFNLCQYGRNDVWVWGSEAGNSWRTGADLGPELNQFFEVALKNAVHGKWTRPGAWSDPDYIQIGYVGNTNGMGLPELTRLSPVEQYSFMSLWALLAAPLFYSGDLTKLNDFSLNVLCNAEVIDVDQDLLGKCASVVSKTENTFVLVKELEDGSRAIGLCNKGETQERVTVKWKEAGLPDSSMNIRDIWRQKNIGTAAREYTAMVPTRGVVLIRVIPSLKK